jgi:putative salt-induced outer membrane protein YdiY
MWGFVRSRPDRQTNVSPSHASNVVPQLPENGPLPCEEGESILPPTHMALFHLLVRSFHQFFLSTIFGFQMRRSFFGTILCLALTMWLLVEGPVAVSAADVILLNNGDRVSGDILTMEDTVLKVDTDYADVLYIDWDDVKGLTSEKPLWVAFHDGAIIPDGVGVRDGDRLILFRLDPGGPIQLDKIKTLNLFEMSYWGNIGLGGSATSGNTSTETINASGTLTVNKGWHRFILDGRANRGKADGQVTAQNTALNTRWDYFLSKRAYIPFINLLEYDKFQDLSLRSTSIIGVGYDFLDRRANFLTVAVGPTVVYQNFRFEPSMVIPGFSWQPRWNLEFLGGDLKLWHVHTGTRDIGRDNAVRLNANQGISIKVYQDLSIRFEYNVRYNSKPADGRKTTDTTIIFGLSLDLLG